MMSHVWGTDMHKTGRISAPIQSIELGSIAASSVSSNGPFDNQYWLRTLYTVHLTTLTKHVSIVLKIHSHLIFLHFFILYFFFTNIYVYVLLLLFVSDNALNEISEVVFQKAIHISS